MLLLYKLKRILQQYRNIATKMMNASSMPMPMPIPSFVSSILDSNKMAKFANHSNKCSLSYRVFVDELREDVFFEQQVLATMYENHLETTTLLKKHEQMYAAFKATYNMMQKTAPLLPNFDTNFDKMNAAEKKYVDYIATLDAQTKEELALIEKIQAIITEKRKVVQEYDFIRNAELEQFVSV